MHIAEYQRWLEAYDRARGFDRVEPAQTLVHALEEMGEIAREVLYLEGYREPDDLDDRRALLASELADCMTFLFKLAYQFGIDMEAALQANQIKADNRFPIEEGRRVALRYLARQRARRQRDEIGG
jgi:NTP pyrophosphatase (non-canonical NTP hydrolase)